MKQIEHSTIRLTYPPLKNLKTVSTNNRAGKLPVASSEKSQSGQQCLLCDFTFYALPNTTSYYVKEYIGAGGNVTIPTTVIIKDDTKPVTKIYAEVFCQRSDVTSVTLPEGLQYIGNKAFYGTGITTLSLPNSITGLGDMALASCPALASINIGTGVSEVSSNAFINCPNLATITVAAGNTALKAEDGVLFSKSGTSLYVCAAKGAKSGDYTVPSGVSYVYDNAFAYCTQLTPPLWSVPPTTCSLAARTCAMSISASAMTGSREAGSVPPA